MGGNTTAGHLSETKDAIFATGAGVYEGGKYIQVAFEFTGQGQFLPVAAAGASPYLGEPGRLEQVLEYRVEILCEGRDVAQAAVRALKRYFTWLPACLRIAICGVSPLTLGPSISANALTSYRKSAHPYEVPGYEVYKLEDM